MTFVNIIPKVSLEFLSEDVSYDSKIVVGYKVHDFLVVFVLVCNYNGIAFVGLGYHSSIICWIFFNLVYGLFSLFSCLLLYVFPFFVACLVVLYYVLLGDVCSRVQI